MQDARAAIATDVRMNGGQINFDPPFAAAGDTSNASMGGLVFMSNTVDALMTVGQNSMVSLGSTDAEWLRTEVQRFQSEGKGLWGQDITAALALRAPQTLDAAGGINVDGTWVTGGCRYCQHREFCRRIPAGGGRRRCRQRRTPFR